MAHILLKKVPDSSVPSAPNSGYLQVFSNINSGGELYYKDHTGAVYRVDSGTSSISGSASTTSDPIIEVVTYSDLVSRINSSTLATASYYQIVDFRTVYDRPNFYLDGTSKSTIENVSASIVPIIVQAIGNNVLGTWAYQPSYPNDILRYDWSFTQSEINLTAAYGRITERIDDLNNRTDFDHRTIQYRRYNMYRPDTKLTGTVSSVDFSAGSFVGDGTLFLTEMSANDVIILNDSGTLIGVKILNISSDTTAVIYTDPTFTPSLGTGVTIYSSSIDGYSYKESYVAQESQFDYVDVFTFKDNLSKNNYIGNYSNDYLSTGNPFILSNVDFGTSSYSNKIGNYFYNNSIGDNCFYNNIDGDFNSNTIGNYFNSNKIQSEFSSNLIGDIFFRNNLTSEFSFNLIKDNFRYNSILANVTYEDFTLSTHVYGNYNCDIFQISSGSLRLRYYNELDILNVTDVTE
jgi:hypothetical protein